MYLLLLYPRKLIHAFFFRYSSLSLTLFLPISLSLSLSLSIHIYIYIRVDNEFCNILVMWGTNRQFRMILNKSWRWWTMLYYEMMPSLPNTLSATFRIWLYGLEHSLWIHAFRSTDVAWSSRFLQPKQNFLNHLVTVSCSTAPFTLYTINACGCFRGVMVQFELVKHKFTNLTTLYVRLRGFQIPPRVKQGRTWSYSSHALDSGKHYLLQALDVSLRVESEDIWEVTTSNTLLWTRCSVFIYVNMNAFRLTSIYIGALVVNSEWYSMPLTNLHRG